MAMNDIQRGAAIAMAFAHSQGRDPEGGLPQGQSSMSIEGPNIQDNTDKGQFAPPQVGPGLPMYNPQYQNGLKQT